MGLTTADDIRTRLESSGFEFASHSVLPSKSELRWSKGWEVIESSRGL